MMSKKTTPKISTRFKRQLRHLQQIPWYKKWVWSFLYIMQLQGFYGRYWHKKIYRIPSMKNLVYKFCKLSAIEKKFWQVSKLLVCAHIFVCAHFNIAHVRVRKCIFLSISHSLFLYWTVVQWHITIYSAYLMYMVRGDSKVKKNEKKNLSPNTDNFWDSLLFW